MEGAANGCAFDAFAGRIATMKVSRDSSTLFMDSHAGMKHPLHRFVLLLCAALALAFLTGCGAPFSNVFMGDSITAFWFVPGMNLGYPGDTTAQMLVRYPSEVSGHGFRTFILLGGTNDVRHLLPSEIALANIAAMATRSRAANMNVVLCMIPPIYEDKFKLDPAVRALNALIRQYAEDQHYYLVDYYDPMVGHPEYFKDQLHPNALGYSVMDKALVPVLQEIAQK